MLSISKATLRSRPGAPLAGPRLQVGAEIAVNGAETNPALLALGVAATLGAISFAGNIATSALKDLDLDLEE